MSSELLVQDCLCWFATARDAVIADHTQVNAETSAIGAIMSAFDGLAKPASRNNWHQGIFLHQVGLTFHSALVDVVIHGLILHRCPFFRTSETSGFCGVGPEAFRRSIFV